MTIKAKPKELFNTKVTFVFFIVVFGFLGLYFIFNSRAASQDTANLWVDNTSSIVHSCTRQSSTEDYATASSSTNHRTCSSINDAYAAAAPGDLVYVKGGSYGDQVINDIAAKDGAAWNGTSGVKPITIKNAPTETVTANDLTTHASNIILDGINTPISDSSGVGEPTIIGPSHDVTIQNLKGRAFYVTGAAYNILIKNIEIGPRVAGSGSQIKTATNGGDDPDPAQQPHDITIDGLYIHDYTTDNPGTGHMDCLHVFYHYNLTVKNSKFIRCGLPNAGYGILLGSNGPGRIEHDLFENNIFDGAIAGFALRGGAGEDFNDVQVRNNSGGLITTQTTNALTNVNWVANAASDIGPCRANSYSYNVSTATACGSTDLLANPKFTNPTQGDYTLQSTSPAIAHGSPSNHPITDILGNSRKSIPDAGAYEYQNSSPSSQLANLWIDNDGGSCTFSQQPVAYDTSKACSGISGTTAIPQALSAIGSGKGETTVKIIAGQYPGQTIADDTRADSDRVTFSEYNGDVEFDFLDIHGDSLTLNDFKTLRPYWTTDWSRGVSVAGSNTPSKGVKLNNIIAQSGLYLTNSIGTRITGGEICCTLADSSRDAKVLSTGASNVVDTVIDGVAIHDAHRSAGSIHSECAFLMSVNNITIKNSKFYNCTVYNVSLGRVNHDGIIEPDPKDVVFENNVFEPTDNLTPGDKGGYFNISLGHVNTRYENLTFRNNSIASPIQFFDVTEPDTDTPTGAYSKTYFYSNMMNNTGRCTTPSQPAGQPLYDYNIVDISSSGCGSNQKVVADTKALWVDPVGHNYRLKAANNAGSPNNSTITDIVGSTRKTTPDVGAYEYTGSGSGSTCSTKQGDTNNDNAVNIQDISLILGAYGQTNTTSCIDVTKDGNINIQDISLVLSKYGT